MPAMTGVLAEIVENTKREVEAAKARTPLVELEGMVAQQEPARNFFRAVTHHPTPDHISIIAEVKRKSPSAGLIRPEYATDGPGGFDPVRVATRYYENGAAAISCLTDQKYFGGDIRFIERIRDAIPIPVLRKDFIVDPYQLWESRAHGADAVLLIAECLSLSQLLDLMILAQQLQLTTLLEVHDAESVLRVRPHVGFPHPAYALLGINNRDLTTQTVHVNHTLRMLDLVEDTKTLVSESGIRSRTDLDRLHAAGVRIALVGEHLMRSDDPGRALAELLRRT
jgi:indole-3-glycerol phosphate synthase